MSADKLQERIDKITKDNKNYPTASDKANAIEKAKEVSAAEVAADEVNAKRAGKGTRATVAQTRGKGSMVITYEAFDEEKPETLPSSVVEFVQLTNVSDDAKLAALLVEGFNAVNYREASDPIAEYVNASWPDDIKTSFRSAVRQTAKSTGMSFEDVAAFMVPKINERLSA